MKVINKEKKGGVTVYIIDKLFDDVEANVLKNSYLQPYQIKTIINENVDIYDKDNKLLLKFRKKLLPIEHIDNFYDNIISFANSKTNNRGSTSGSNKKNVYKNPKIKSNIFGFFDCWGPQHKFKFKNAGFKPLTDVRECRFNKDWPEKYKETLPLIKDIDGLYKELTPQQYANQYSKSKQTPFKIANTSFTTITTNVNFQTTVHKDKGDDIEGFGNLCVIERGEYSGGETCFPQYGLGINVRNGDILFMDVHQWHANLPIIYNTPDAVRLSIVCYLRYNIWKRTKGKTKKFMIRHNNTIKKYMK